MIAKKWRRPEALLHYHFACLFACHFTWISSLKSHKVYWLPKICIPWHSGMPSSYSYGQRQRNKMTKTFPQKNQDCASRTQHKSSSPAVFSEVGVAQAEVSCVVFYRSCFVLLCLFCWPSVLFNLLILITPLVSSNSSYKSYGKWWTRKGGRVGGYDKRSIYLVMWHRYAIMVKQMKMATMKCSK